MFVNNANTRRQYLIKGKIIYIVICISIICNSVICTGCTVLGSLVLGVLGALAHTRSDTLNEQTISNLTNFFIADIDYISGKASFDPNLSFPTECRGRLVRGERRLV